MENPEEMDEFTVKLKVICTQTVKVKASNEDEAREKANEGEGKIIFDFDWYEAYEQDNWEVTKKTQQTQN